MFTAALRRLQILPCRRSIEILRDRHTLSALNPRPEHHASIDPATLPNLALARKFMKLNGYMAAIGSH